MLRLRTVLLVAIVCLLAPKFSHAGVVPVSADVTVNTANPNSNLNTITTRGGLLSGLDDTGSDYHFYLKFNLAGVQSSDIHKATLVGTYTDKFSNLASSFHQLFFVADDSWTETTITYNNRPAIGSPVSDGFNATGHQPGDTIDFDVTAAAISEAAGDGVLSLALMTVDGRFGDLEYFASREFNSAQAFRLEIQTTGSVVPLPSPLIAGFALLCVAIFIVHRRAARIAI